MMNEKDLYPCVTRDTSEKIAHWVSENGPDFHDFYPGEIPQGASEDAGAAAPVAAPSDPEGHAEGYGDHVGSGSDNPKPGPSA